MLLSPLRWFALGLWGAVTLAAADLDREIVLAPHSGSAPEDREIVHWQERVGADANSAAAFERLAWAYVAKARRTLDAGFYKLAEKTTDVMEKSCGTTDASRLVRGHVLHNLHHFRAAETIARSLVGTRGWPVDLALLSDVLLEQGRLGETVEVLQRLANLKPGLEAYSRIAHVRWLKGDVAGARAALRAAERAAAPQEREARAWIVVRWSGLALQEGDGAGALTLARSALELVQDYPPARLAEGRAAMALGRRADALSALQIAAGLNPLPEYQWWLADAWRAAGRDDEAEKVERQLKLHGEASDPRTYALYLATRGERSSLAVRLARAELAERGDVFTRDALAWAAFAAGDLDTAHLEMRAALAEGTKDARLFLHAGEIARARGEMSAAETFFASARGAAGTLTPSEHARLPPASARAGAAP